MTVWFTSDLHLGHTWGINVGVDWWDYRPVSAERLAEHLEDLRSVRVAPVTDDSDR